MKRTAFMLVFLLSACAGFGFAEPGRSNLIGDIPGRTTISLNGAWHAIVDPYGIGAEQRFFLDSKPKNKLELVEYDFDASSVLNVPGDWNSQRENLFFYEGSVWYKKSFPFQKKEHGRVFLYFGAATNRATVYLNGAKLGQHEGGYTPFNFEVTSQIRDGENLLVVEVNNQRRADAVPALKTDWWNYGGLTRDVLLVEEPDAFIQDYFVQLSKATPDEVAGWVQLNGVKGKQEVTIEIPEVGVKKVAATNDAGYAEFRFRAKLKLWSPEDPKLYKVVVSGAGETVTDQIGFRTIETNGSKIVLNGKPILLRGISLHEEAPFRGGKAYSEEDDRTLLGWAKELGCNFVRLAHYPHNEGMTRLADKMGLLVWSEVPVYWDTAWTNPATLTNAQEQIRDNVARDHNRASVIFWSMGNETPIDADRTEFFKKNIAFTKQLDNTRLITAAFNRVNRSEANTRTFDDPLGEYLDVLGINEYVGWYSGKLEDTATLQWKMAYKKPLIITEFGAEAPAGKHGDADALWTEEYQARFYESHIAMVTKIREFAGMSPWVLMDFRSPRRLLPGAQDYRNRKGVISDRGERKKAFYVLQKFYMEGLHASN